MVQKHSILIKIKCLFSLACKCLYYLAPNSFSCLIFRCMQALALLQLGHALSCSHDFPYALPSVWNVCPPPVFLINVYSTIKFQLKRTSLESSSGTPRVMNIPFATLAKTDILSYASPYSRSQGLCLVSTLH